MSKSLVIVTIDGPPAAGKSTAASALAQSLGYVHLNSGALYRAVGMLGDKGGIDLTDDNTVSEFAKKINFKFVVTDQGFTTLLVNGKDYGAELRNERVGDLASKIGALPNLRKVLTEVQRDVSKTNSVVLEGRDAGTVVFPNATVKFYLDASFDIRAERRVAETAQVMKDKGLPVPEHDSMLAGIRHDMETRDERDRNRAASPLSVAPDAICIDTTGHTITQTVKVMEKTIAELQK